MSRCASFVQRVPVCVDMCVSSSGLLLGVSGDLVAVLADLLSPSSFNQNKHENPP